MYARDEAVIATPVGNIRVTSNGGRLSAISITDDPVARSADTDLVREAVRQLQQWFAGERTSFDLPLMPAHSARGEALRQAIAGIGYGDTISYGALARLASSGARAIGQACARNPFPILIPCHRVLAAQGKLGAYSAGDGPTTKQWLLDHERRYRKG